MTSLVTRISLPPSLLSSTEVRELLELLLEKYRWFRPARYGFASLDASLDPKQVDYTGMVALYEELKAVTVAAKTDRDFLSLFSAKPSDHPLTGGITWVTSAATTTRMAWRERHLREVAEVMRRVHSPIAVTALDEDVKSKTHRWIPNVIGETLTFTVRDYGEGLAGLFWRNFFGPPFVRLFGERLASLPSEFKQELGDGIVMVQPYELPTQAGTPEATARERQLIQHLGPECFYDHEHHRKPTRILELLSPPA